jgi:hypothetical protein
MSREEFNRWIELSPEELADQERPQGKPAHGLPFRWTKRRPQPIERMPGILVACDRKVDRRDWHADRRRQETPYEWPPTRGDDREEAIGRWEPNRPPDNDVIWQIRFFMRNSPRRLAEHRAGGHRGWPKSQAGRR